MFDDVDLGTRDRDAVILGLFHRWQAAMMQPLHAVNSPVDEALTKVVELENAIIETPASGVTGLAVKAYFLALGHLGGSASNPCALATFHERDYQAPGGRLFDGDRALKALIEDAVRLVPELAPLAAGFIASPNQIKNGSGLACA